MAADRKALWEQRIIPHHTVFHSLKSPMASGVICPNSRSSSVHDRQLMCQKSCIRWHGLTTINRSENHWNGLDWFGPETEGKLANKDMTTAQSDLCALSKLVVHNCSTGETLSFILSLFAVSPSYTVWHELKAILLSPSHPAASQTTSSHYI